MQVAAGSTLDSLSAKGDLLTRTSSGYTRLAVGADTYVLTADSAQAAGIKWAAAGGGMTDPTTTKGDLIVHGTSTTRLGVGSDNQVLTADSTQTLGVKWGAAGAASLSTASAFLGANVTMTNANTFYDAASLSLAAGTWLIVGQVTVAGGTGTDDLTVRIWDGTTTYAEVGGPETAGTTFQSAVSLCCIKALGSTTTVKLSAALDTAGGILRADPRSNSSGAHVSSGISAVKVA